MSFDIYKCKDHSMENDIFCTQEDCNQPNRICCSKCVALGPHKFHSNNLMKDVQQQMMYYLKNEDIKFNKNNDKAEFQFLQTKIKSTFLSIKKQFEDNLTLVEKRIIEQVSNILGIQTLLNQIRVGTIDKVVDIKQQNQIVHLLDHSKFQFYTEKISNIEAIVQELLDKIDGKIKRFNVTINDQLSELIPAYNTYFDSRQVQGKIIQDLKSLHPIKIDYYDEKFNLISSTQLNSNQSTEKSSSIVLRNMSKADEFLQRNIYQYAELFLKIAEKKLLTYHNYPEYLIKVWRLPEFDIIKQFKLSVSPVIQWLKLSESQVILFQADKTVQILNVEKGLQEQKLEVNTDGPIKKVSLIDSQQFICTAGDRMIMLWNAKLNLCEKYFQTEDYVVSLIHFDRDHFISGHKQKVRIWNYKQPECLRSTQCHNNWIDILIKLNNKEFGTASSDSVIKLWDFVSLNLLKQIQLNHDCIIQQVVKLDNSRLAIVTEDCQNEYIKISTVQQQEVNYRNEEQSANQLNNRDQVSSQSQKGQKKAYHLRIIS